MPSPFREEHEQFRKTVRQFCEKELAPYVEEWEKRRALSERGLQAAGELGIFGAHYPEEIGGARRRLLVLASPRARSSRGA